MEMFKIEKAIIEMKDDFNAIAMARPPFVLKKFVIGAHDHPAQQWAHCVLEMRIKYDAIRRAQISREILNEEINELEKTGKKADQLKAELKRIDIEEQDRATLGAIREFEALYEIYQSFNQRYTREELNHFQADYWRNRILRQSEQDYLATGRISASNQEALRQIGIAPPNQNQQISNVQNRYLSQGNRRLLVVVPTEHKANNGLPVLDGLIFPGTIERKIHNIYGLPIDKAYNEAAMMALREKVDYLLTIEDDIYPPNDGLLKLLSHQADIIGGWYPMRHKPIEGVPIIIKNSLRQQLEPDGKIHGVYTIPQGFTLFKVDVFHHIPYPWFVTTSQLSQDSYFSQQAREAGYRLLCNTSILCKHIDRNSGRVFEYA